MENNQIFLKDKALNAQNVLESVEDFLDEQIDINEDEPILINYYKDIEKKYISLKNFYIEKFKNKNQYSFLEYLAEKQNKIDIDPLSSSNYPEYPPKKKKRKKKRLFNFLNKFYLNN